MRSYVRSSLRGHFGAVRVRLDSPDPRPTPTLLHATHVSWWDGYLGLAVAEGLGLDLRVMMLASELHKYAFLRYGGAFGFDPASPGDVRAVLRYSAACLGGVGPVALLVFPAGGIGPPQARPLPYRPGAAQVALQAAPVSVRAVAWRLEHRADQRPEALVRVGPPRFVVPGPVSLRPLAEAMRADLTLEADRLEADLRESRLEGYRPWLRGRASVAENWDAVRRLIGVKV